MLWLNGNRSGGVGCIGCRGSWCVGGGTGSMSLPREAPNSLY